MSGHRGALRARIVDTLGDRVDQAAPGVERRGARLIERRAVGHHEPIQVGLSEHPVPVHRCERNGISDHAAGRFELLQSGLEIGEPIDNQSVDQIGKAPNRE